MPHNQMPWNLVFSNFRLSLNCMIYFLQSYCTVLPSWPLVNQYLGRPTTWPVLLRLMYHQLFSGCTPVMALQWPMVVTSLWGLREPLAQPPPSPSHSALWAHLMEDSIPAGQLLTHLHQQWMPQETWLSKVSIVVKSIVWTCWEECVFRELDISLLERCKTFWEQMCKLAFDLVIASSLKVLFQTQQRFEFSLTVSTKPNFTL